jgi:hypothetical protein
VLATNGGSYCNKFNAIDALRECGLEWLPKCLSLKWRWRNVEIFVGYNSPGNHLLDSISGFLAEAAQQPFEESHVRFGKVHHWNPEQTGLNSDSNSKGWLKRLMRPS